MSSESISHTGSETHHEELSTLIVPTVNFLVFLGVLITLYKKKIQPAMVLRANNFQASLAKVEEAEQEFQNQIESLRYQLEKIGEEEKQVIESFISEGRLSAEVITKNGLAEISRLQSETAQTKVNLVSQLEDEVRDIISSKAMKLAADKLAQALTPEMDKNLREKVLRSV